MEQIEIKSFEHYHQEVTGGFDPGTLFRGVSESSYELIPSIGRYLPSFTKIGKNKKDLLDRKSVV